MYTCVYDAYAYKCIHMHIDKHICMKIEIVLFLLLKPMKIEKLEGNAKKETEIDQNDVKIDLIEKLFWFQKNWSWMMTGSSLWER